MVVETVKRIAPHYTMSERQLDRVSKNSDPEALASVLPGAVESLARNLADNAQPAPFDWRIVPIEWMLDAIDFDRAVSRYHVGWSTMAQKIGSRRVFELGRIVERYKDRGHDIDLICAEYQRHQGRNPDHAGLLFWLDALDRGDRSAVFAAMVAGLR